MIYNSIQSIDHTAMRAENMAYKSILLHVAHLRFEHGLSIRKIAKRIGHKEWEVKDMIAAMEEHR